MIAVIKDSRLPRRDRSDLLIKSRGDLILSGLFDRAGSGPMSIADFSGSAQPLTRFHPGNRHEIQSAADKPVTEHIFAFADCHRVVLRVNTGNENRVSHRESEVFSLADRIVRDSLVRSEVSAVFIDESAGRGHTVAGCAVKVACIVVIRDKTDLLAVRFCSDRKALFLRNLPDIFLVIIAYRHQRMRKLILRQLV